MHEGSRRAIIAAFFANLGIAISKFVGFIITGSAGLLAEAVHSLADTGTQALLMLGSKRGSRPPDRAHPFGYGPERYFWAFVVAMVLFSMGGLFALMKASTSSAIPTSSTTRSWHSSSCSSRIGLESSLARQSRSRTTSVLQV
jgi:cation diffusion facilitator family transporter